MLGVPSNDFGSQEPGKADEIKDFCETTFNVDFPLTSKEHVKGDNAHPFYKWAKTQVGVLGSPKWNFHKYLIGPDGTLAGTFPSKVDTLGTELTTQIEALL